MPDPILDLWCVICDRGAEGCDHPIRTPDGHVYDPSEESPHV